MTTMTRMRPGSVVGGLVAGGVAVGLTDGARAKAGDVEAQTKAAENRRTSIRHFISWRGFGRLRPGGEVDFPADDAGVVEPAARSADFAVFDADDAREHLG